MQPRTLSVPSTTGPCPLSIARGAALALALSSFLAGCGGGSSSGVIEGLSVADSMSVITTDPGSTPTGGITPPAQVDPSIFASTADYHTDRQNARVYDPSMDTLATVNQILCMISQTGYVDLVNEGLYKAQVDTAKCDNGSDQGSSSSDQGQSSGANAEQPQIWVAHSERASNSDDQIVEFWVPGDGDDGPPRTIWVRMTVSAGASAENPFGVFSLNFAGVPDGGTIDDAVFHGTLATLDATAGNVGFSFYENHGDVTVAQDPGHHSELVQANVTMSADQTTGMAHILRTFRENYSGTDSGIQTAEYALAFDPTNVSRAQDSNPAVCLSRTDFASQVWSYNLYDSTTGDRIELDSGFGFRTEDGAYGWMGYYGMWTPNGVTVNAGDTVTRQTFGHSDSTQYTVVKSPGKLIKNTRRTISLSLLDGERFQWWDFGPPPPPPSLGAPSPQQYLVEYHAAAFQRIATWDPMTQQYDDLPSPVVIDTSAYHYLGMYSDSLGGPVSFVDGENFIHYWSQEFVNASSDLFGIGETSVALYGYFDCLRAGILGSEAQAGNVYLPPSSDVGTPYAFSFDRETLTLLSENPVDTFTPVGLASGETYSGGPFGWGLRTGPLVTDASGFTNVQDIWQADVFYTWETGPNPWNQYASLIDGLGNAVSFDPPIQFRYTHETANDRNGDSSYDGRTFVLQYGGPGNLSGLPFHGIDLDDDGNPDRYYPVLSLVDGTLVGRTGTEYVVKATNLELTLSLDSASGACDALDTAAAALLTLPDGSDYVAPDIGPPPTIDEAPRCIEGEVLGSANN